ncbi:MAG: hypothetical protein Q8M92_01200 [Candidatus Subteraquimicrobiales bacterium]|nr:hypothetical protein [Candidatus Subteraquimicrobiales bacterium]
MINLSCCDCIHFHGYISGDGWNEPYEIDFECDYEGSSNPKISEKIYKIMESEDLDHAENCLFYDAGQCNICKQPMKKTKPHIQTGMYNTWRICSEKCQTKAKIKEDQEIAEFQAKEF